MNKYVKFVLIGLGLLLLAGAIFHKKIRASLMKKSDAEALKNAMTPGPAPLPAEAQIENDLKRNVKVEKGASSGANLQDGVIVNITYDERKSGFDLGDPIAGSGNSGVAPPLNYS